jgi:NAD(P)-dependent dehydrogenase (short-subunit alcohol dehydrogenase family)
MSKIIAIVGFGPGTATAVAERFAAEGFSVASVGRNEERLAAGVAALSARGATAFGFPADAGDPVSVRAALRSIRSQMGPVSVLHWNAYGGLEAGDLLTADPAVLRSAFDAPIFGLLAGLGEVLPDLKNGGALLVSNGAFGDISSQMDAAAVVSNAMGIALSSSAKHKLVGLLAQRLKADGVYVGEVMVYGTIKGTPSGNDSSIDPAMIAQEFWTLYTTRNATRVSIGLPLGTHRDWEK